MIVSPPPDQVFIVIIAKSAILIQSGPADTNSEPGDPSFSPESSPGVNRDELDIPGDSCYYEFTKKLVWEKVDFP